MSGNFTFSIWGDEEISPELYAAQDHSGLDAAVSDWMDDAKKDAAIFPMGPDVAVKLLQQSLMMAGIKGSPMRHHFMAALGEMDALLERCKAELGKQKKIDTGLN